MMTQTHTKIMEYDSLLSVKVQRYFLIANGFVLCGIDSLNGFPVSFGSLFHQRMDGIALRFFL